jgi:hypothetical protein
MTDRIEHLGLVDTLWFVNNYIDLPNAMIRALAVRRWQPVLSDEAFAVLMHLLDKCNGQYTDMRIGNEPGSNLDAATIRRAVVEIVQAGAGKLKVDVAIHFQKPDEDEVAALPPDEHEIMVRDTWGAALTEPEHRLAQLVARHSWSQGLDTLSMTFGWAAQALGVSTATVTRALNGLIRAGAATKENNGHGLEITLNRSWRTSGTDEAA